MFLYDKEQLTNLIIRNNLQIVFLFPDFHGFFSQRLQSLRSILMAEETLRG